MNVPGRQSGIPWFGRRDPWWDLEGRNVRRQGRRRRVQRFILELSIVLAMLVVLGSTLGSRPVFGAGLTLDLDQWASKSLAWQNGDLNGNNSRYPEGGVVPFRLAIEGLAPGSHSIHINYDFTAGGHKAYDFLAKWNITNASGKACAPSGGAISSMCPSLPASSSAAFPADSFVANGLSVHGAEVYSGAPRQLTIWGGTITSISGPVHTGSVNGNSSADFFVRFSSTGSAVLLAWGGHLAQSAFWDKAAGGSLDGAAQVSGAPWHMRTLQLDGSGNKNQDRSIQPSAIVGALPPFALAPTPPPSAVAPTPAPDAPRPPSVPIPPGLLATVPPTATEPGPTAASDRGAPFLIALMILGIAWLPLMLARRRERRPGR